MTPILQRQKYGPTSMINDQQSFPCKSILHVSGTGPGILKVKNQNAKCKSQNAKLLHAACKIQTSLFNVQYSIFIFYRLNSLLHRFSSSPHPFTCNTALHGPSYCQNEEHQPPQKFSSHENNNLYHDRPDCIQCKHALRR